MLQKYNNTNRSWKEVWEYYRDIRFDNLLSSRYNHTLWVLFWPLFGLAFGLMERAMTVEYHPVYCALDDKIPFCEWFVIPYYYWFAFLIGALVYTFLVCPTVFKRSMRFIAFTYITTLIIYLIYPTKQELRPEHFVRENILTRIMESMYNFDTNTNVCPSIHVLGAFGGCFALMECEPFCSRRWRCVSMASALLISVSTVFVKQHSVLDVVYALLLCAVGYVVVYGRHLHKTEKTAVTVK